MEVYDITEEFFQDYDFVSKPDESKWNKKVVPWKKFDHLTHDQMVAMVGQHLPKGQLTL